MNGCIYIIRRDRIFFCGSCIREFYCVTDISRRIRESVFELSQCPASYTVAEVNELCARDDPT